MTEDDTDRFVSDGRSVSRRTTIRSGIAVGLSTVGLTSLAAAHEEDEADEGSEKEDETDDESEEEEKEDEADDESEQEEEDEDELEASISIDDHETDGDSVEVDEVSMSNGGFVSIHDRRRFPDNGGQVLDSIIGITDFLESGNHDDVSVPLFTDEATAPGPEEGQDDDGLTESQPLIAIPHRDETDTGTFEGDDPAYEVGDRTLDVGAVNDIATVYVEDDDAREDAEEETEDAIDQFGRA